jgi:sigma-E factor negative regulatory protein RseA
MSQLLEQQLSEFLDGELPAEQLDLLLARLDREPAQRATLARYAMIGECLRGGAATPSALGVAERVRSALLESPAQPPPRMPATRRGWLVGAAAAATSVAAILLLGPEIRGLRQAEPAMQDVATLRLMDEPLSPVTAAANHRLTPGAAARLTSYLVAHGQYANQLSRSTFDSHLVTARAERASWRQFQDPISDR